MIISELSYLEVVEETGIAGAGGTRFFTKIDKNVDIDVDVDVNVDKYVNAEVDLDGNLATSEGSADAFGKNTLTEVEVFAQTTSGSSESFGSALAATGG